MSAYESDVLIIGGGAAGLVAAASAVRAGASVCLVERAERVGKKILATGNGRCNLSNASIEGADASAHYNQPAFVAPTLARYGCEAIRVVFEEFGLLTICDERGWVFPRTRSANSVLDVLRGELERQGVVVRAGCGVDRITAAGHGFCAEVGKEQLASRALVLACGVAPLCGATGLLRDIEPQRMVAPTPVLGPLKTDAAPLKGLDGVRADCLLRLLDNGDLIAEENGEVLFRRFGISGIAAFNLSRFARAGHEVSLDLFPEYAESELHSLLAARARLHPHDFGPSFFDGLLHTRLAQALFRRLGTSEAIRPNDKMFSKLANMMKDYRLEVLAGPDETQAQVTRGGLAVDGFDPSTLQSRSQPRLFAAGECLDIDGPCGGFNLHWAWASGFAAGQNAAETARASTQTRSAS
jgi:predicted Rossmann fold flavoprotein